MAVDRFREIVGRIERAFCDETLTKEMFVEAWRELEQLLGDGDEAEAIESLALFARDDWMEEVAPSDPDQPIVMEYLG